MASPARLSATRRIGYPAAPAVDFLGELGAAGRARVLEGSARVTFPPGTVLFQIGDPHYAVIVEAGLLRTFRSTPDGRQSTMSYLHARELFGATGSLGVALTAHLQVVS